MNNNQNTSPPIWEFSKIPPQAVDLEEAVLSTLLLEGKAMTDYSSTIESEMFYRESHQIIYKAMEVLFSNHEPVDTLTVIDQLKKTGELDVIGGPFYFTEITKKFVHAENIEKHIKIIKEKFLKREVIRVSSENLKLAYEDTTDVFDLIDSGTNQFVGLNEKTITDNNTQKLGEISAEVMDIVEKTRNEGFVPGIHTGLTSFDKNFHGFSPSDLIIIAARPGMGKTALIVTIARNIALKGTPIAIFSLEMSRKQIGTRFFLQEVNVSFMDMRKATDLSDNQMVDLKQGLTKIEGYPLFIDDTAGINPSKFRAKAQKLVRKDGVKLIIVDYLQLMNADPDKRSNNREQEISSISRTLKAIAKDLDVPIIALSQLSRAVETRGGSKKPILSDLRESGAIEQDADAVVFIYRPEYYKIDQDEDGNSTAGIAELLIAKHRNGTLGDCIHHFNGRRMRFENCEDINEDLPKIPFNDSINPSINFEQQGPEDDIPF